jgi:energy-coupling factor transporter ATP-binding protein EcfA2
MIVLSKKVRSKRKHNKIIRRSIVVFFVLAIVFLQLLKLPVRTLKSTSFEKYIGVINALLNKITLGVSIIFGLLILLEIILILIDGQVFSNRNVSQAFRYHKLKNKLDKSLIDNRIYLEPTEASEERLKVVKTPKTFIDDEETLYIENITGVSDKLDRFKSELTAMLDGSHIVDTYQLDKSANYYIARLIDMSGQNRYYFDSCDEYLATLKSSKQYEIPMMKNLKIDVAKTPHMLVAGGTGTGKSYLLYHLLFNFILKKCDVYLIDRKKVLTKFNGIVGQENVGDEHPEEEDSNIFDVIEKVESIMNEREQYLSENEDTQEDLNVTFVDMDWLPVVLVIDELGSLMAELSTKKNKDKFKNILQSIVQRGRATGVNIVVSMQQPNANNLPTAIRDNLMFKTILGDTDNTTRSLVFPVGELPDIAFKAGEGYFTLAGKHNKPSILFVPTFKIPLTIETLRTMRDESL